MLETTPARGDLRLAFAGLSDLLEASLPAMTGKLPPPQERALRVALLLQDAPPVPSDPRVIASAVRAALGVLATSAPVLLVIDDVQWLDAPSAAAVGFAVRRLEHEQVGLLCGQRTSRAGDDLPLELDRARLPVDLLPVGGLSAGALHRMLRTRLGASFSGPTLHRIESESGGNPFVALEIAWALTRRGVTSAGTGALPVPDTLSALVAEHLGELAPSVLNALQLVAVMPDAPARQYLGAGVSGADLDAAVLAGVLEAHDGRLRYSHPLLASAMSGSIPPVRQRELHLIAARAVRSPEERVRHRALGAAGESATVAAEADAAAGAAAARGAPGHRQRTVRAGRIADARRPAGRILAPPAAARQHTIAGDIAAAKVTLDELIGSMPAGPVRADALTLLGSLQDDLAAGTTLLHRALAEADDEPGRRADIHLALSEIWLTRGDQQSYRAQAQLALAYAERAEDPALLASCLAQAFMSDQMSGTDVDPGQLERAVEIERDLERAGAIGSLLLRTSPGQVAAIWHYVQGRLDEAEAELTRMLARTGSEDERADTLLRLSRIAGRRGDAIKAAELAADGLQIAEQVGAARLTCALLYGCASAALLLGRAEDVRELSGRGLKLAESAGDRPYAVCHQALLGSLDLALGDDRAAAARLGPMTSQLPEIGWQPTTQSIAPDVVEALIAAGGLDEASAFVSELERAMGDLVTAALVARCRGALAAARGNLDAATAELTTALLLHDQVTPQPLERARTLLVLGKVQRRLNQRAAARRTLSESIQICDGISAPLWAARARAELARVSGRLPGSEELTASEARVAELVSRGLTNRDVAAELFVTVRAVESTLTRTYSKLGVRSRTELAAHLNRAG